mgnify:CR=1 FL=1
MIDLKKFAIEDELYIQVIKGMNNRSGGFLFCYKFNNECS